MFAPLVSWLAVMYAGDQRRMMHARVPYDGANEERLMWRLGWGKDLPPPAAAAALEEGAKL